MDEFNKQSYVTTLLEQVLELEDSMKIEEAFYVYQEIYLTSNPDYMVWKHYYYFIWDLIDGGGDIIRDEFKNKINLTELLKNALVVGQENFSDRADFNFIAGYTISIFPYQYGDYRTMENIGNNMLLKATQMEPDNLIYRMCYLGSLENRDKSLYDKTVIEAAPQVLETYSGKGWLNSYFRKVLYRIDRKY